MKINYVADSSNSRNRAPHYIRTYCVRRGIERSTCIAQLTTSNVEYSDHAIAKTTTGYMQLDVKVGKEMESLLIDAKRYRADPHGPIYQKPRS